jgi:hypothetical protein
MENKLNLEKSFKTEPYSVNIGSPWKKSFDSLFLFWIGWNEQKTVRILQCFNLQKEVISELKGEIFSQKR